MCLVGSHLCQEHTGEVLLLSGAPRSVVKTDSKQITTHNRWGDFKCALRCQKKGSGKDWKRGRTTPRGNKVGKSLCPRALRGVLRAEEGGYWRGRGILLHPLGSSQVSPGWSAPGVQTDPAKNVPVLQASVTCLQLGACSAGRGWGLVSEVCGGQA